MYKAPQERAQALLAEMSLTEKLYQLTGQMLYKVEDDYEEKRNPMCGNYRNPGHFMHWTCKEPVPASQVAARINRDVKKSMEAQPHAIPPIEHGEALHGAQWGMGTVFPQPIGMASTFDDELVAKMGDMIGKECAAVGVRQILAPVVNIVRDCRWGRTIETFGEDVLVSCNMGVAITKGLEKNGVVASPKHFADNYSYGGRDSNYSDTSERTMREVFLKPFEKCFKEGGAQSVMASYNGWEGIPCSANKRLLTEILREEWDFQGFVVSDYGGMEGVCRAHKLVDEEWKAQALCVSSGLEVNLPLNSFEKLMKAYEEGWLTEEVIDKAVLRVLTVKFNIGLFDAPFVDEEKADSIVRCEAHKQAALQGARESIILLKNEGVLPFKKNEIKRIAVFGASAHEFPIGKNYSGPYKREWTAPDAKTPYQYLKEYLGNSAKVIFAEDDQIEEVAKSCDAPIYLSTVVEGEGLDRSDIRLPSITKQVQKDDSAIIVGKFEIEVKANQEESIRKMVDANSNSAVILLNGAPIDMTNWIDGTGAIIEAWYPGEQGAQALCEILFGEVCPSAKLPITFPRNVGQLPLFYSMKPSGRGVGYVENDGSPLYPFGYGLSYTKFAFSDFAHEIAENTVKVTFRLENTGLYEGAEVVQIYLSGRNCDVVMPMKELKAYKRINLAPGQKSTVVMEVPADSFCYYDRKMVYGMHNGDYTVLIGTSSTDMVESFEVRVRDGKVEG